MQAFSCLLNSVSIFSYNFSHLFSVPFSCIHSCVFLVFWSTFGPLFFWKSPADIPVILNYLSRMFVYYCLVTVCSDGLPSEGAAWWGHHLLSACQLTSSRFSCVCARACVIRGIRLDWPENGISAIAVMVTAQYCICLEPRWCVCLSLCS